MIVCDICTINEPDYIEPAQQPHEQDMLICEECFNDPTNDFIHKDKCLTYPLRKPIGQDKVN